MIGAIIATWLELPLWLNAIATFSVWLIVTAGLLWIFQNRWLRPFWNNCLGVVPPFFGSIAVLFSISVGFTSADIWERVERAERIVSHEATTLKLIAYVAKTQGSVGEPVVAATCIYAQTVADKEWPEMLHNHKASIFAGQALIGIMQSLTNPEFSAQVDPLLRRELLSKAGQLAEDRMNRVQLSNTHSNPVKWMLLLFLGCMTQIAIAMVHMDKLRAQTLSLLVFTTAMAGAFILLVGMDAPFLPPFAIDAEAFINITICH